MATSSIFTNVHITTKEGAEKFARALELAEQDGLWRPDPNFKVHTLTKDEIRARFEHKFGKLPTAGEKA
ncbi:MAG: hypothetical protein IJP90_03540 [Treponema sp.]|nr:hypothetical protein [Treponema sp.]